MKELDEIRARAEAATPGPWLWSPEESVWGDCGPNLETAKRGPVYSDGSQGADETVIGSWGHDANGISVDPADAEFISHAREDVPRLLAVIEALSDWAGRSKTGFYDEAQDDVVTIISAAFKGERDDV